MTTAKIKFERAAFTGNYLAFVANVSGAMKRNGLPKSTVANYRNDALLTDRDIMEVTAEYVVLV